jgi:hypothetical protein
MLPLSPKSCHEGSLANPKRSRANASHPRPNLRAPLPSSHLVLYPYSSHSPSHRLPSSITQTPYWRASAASRLSARSPRTTSFHKPFQVAQLTLLADTIVSIAPNVRNRFSLQPFFRTPNQTPSVSGQQSCISDSSLDTGIGNFAGGHQRNPYRRVRVLGAVGCSTEGRLFVTRIRYPMSVSTIANSASYFP